MQCESCKALALSDGSAEVDNNYCCIDCMLINPSLSNNKKSSSIQTDDEGKPSTKH